MDIKASWVSVYSNTRSYMCINTSHWRTHWNILFHSCPVYGKSGLDRPLAQSTSSYFLMRRFKGKQQEWLHKQNKTLPLPHSPHKTRDLWWETQTRVQEMSQVNICWTFLIGWFGILFLIWQLCVFCHVSCANDISHPDQSEKGRVKYSKYINTVPHFYPQSRHSVTHGDLSSNSFLTPTGWW